VSKLVQYLKGKTSRKIQEKFPELRKRYWGKHLWSVGYFVRTSGNVTKDYLDKHQHKDDRYGDFKVEE
jgi:putative transposase